MQSTTIAKNDAQVKYDTASSEVTRLEASRDAANTILENAKTDLKTKLAELAQLEEQLKNAADADKPAIQIQIDGKNVQIEQLKNQIGDANKAGSLTKALADAQKNLADGNKAKEDANKVLQANIASYTAATTWETNAQNTKKSIEDNISDLTNQKRSLTSSNASISNEISADKSSLASEQANQVAKKAELDNAIKAVDAARAILNSFLSATSTIIINGQQFEWGWNKANSEMQDLRNKLSAATQARNNAQNAYDNQHNAVEQKISETNIKINSLKDVNKKIDELNRRINYLLDQDSSFTFDKTIDHANWTHGQEVYEPSLSPSDPSKDQRSIYFAQQKLLYLNNKQSQKQDIYDDMKIKFDALRLQIASAFKLYTIPEER